MTTRERYHHGDLRAALVEAAATAARSGGEHAVRLNQLAAQVGVSASAAYRHFPGGLADLLVAVGDLARAGLSESIAARTAQVAEQGAAARFRAAGEGYVAYVTREPGLFQIACRHAPGPGSADPYGLLERCLDDLVVAGLLPAERRAYASVAAWSAVHGLSLLLTEGPLARLAGPEREAAVTRTLDMVERGL